MFLADREYLLNAGDEPRRPARPAGGLNAVIVRTMRGGQGVTSIELHYIMFCVMILRGGLRGGATTDSQTRRLLTDDNELSCVMSTTVMFHLNYHLAISMTDYTLLYHTFKLADMI